MVTQEMIDRINALARKAKGPEGLTEAEREEQRALRQMYVASVRENLTAQLDRIQIAEADGTKRPLRKKGRDGNYKLSI